MTHAYQVKVFDPNTGVQTALLDYWTTLYIERPVNNFGTHQLTIDLDDSRVPYFVPDAIVEVWRKDDIGIHEWYREYVGLHITPQYEITETGRKLFTSYGRTLEDLLHRRTVRYFSGTPYATKTGMGETVMKAFVAENAATLATSPPRITDGTTTGLTVAADTALGLTWTGSRAWKNLLELLQDIAEATSVDFAIARVGNQPPAYQFQTYYPQLGTDRRASVLFEVELGNMARPTYISSHTEEANDILVLGQGQEDDRTVYNTSDLVAIATSPINRREVNTDARQEDDTAGLAASADAALQEHKAQETFNFQVLQTPSALYGLHYFLGDVVAARFTTVNLAVTKKITRVTIRVAEGKEDIGIELGEINGNPE